MAAGARYLGVVQYGNGTSTVGSTLVGQLAPYIDPRCNCTVQSSFRGQFRKDFVAGTFSAKRDNSPAVETGTWSAKRSH